MSLRKEVQKIEAATQTIQKYLPRLSAPKVVRNELFYLWASTLIGLLVFTFMTNTFLDFYYAVPESPKYIKTSAYQIALKVNRDVNESIEFDYQKKLAQINPKGSNQAVKVNSVVGASEEETMKVRGSLIGKNVNEIIGTVDAEPLRLTTAYQKGLESSYNTGNKYYDVDLKVGGWEKGLMVGNTGHDEFYAMNLFTASLGIVEQADQVLRIDLDAFLNQSTDREYSLRSYLAHLHNVEASLKNTQVKVNKEISTLLKAENSARLKMEKTESDFFVALNKFDKNGSYENLDLFVEDYQAEVDKKARLQAMNQIDKYFAAYLPLLTERLEAVEANRNALVHGITVVAFRDVDLGLIKIAK